MSLPTHRERWQAERRFWKWVARKVDPHLKQGVHIDGMRISTDEPLTISGMNVYGNGGTAIKVEKGATGT